MAAAPPPLRLHLRRRAGLVLLGLVAALLIVLALEGASSALRGRSLLRRALDPGSAVHTALLDAERRAAAAATPGPLALSLDPHVGFLCKPSFRHAFLGAEANTDEHGQRVRPRGAPAPGQRRIVVLGDSVAFGMGVLDHQTYAAQLETLLDRALPPSAPRPAVLTVACPGWNVESASRYLRAHLERLAPDLVCWMLINNDLGDGCTVTESGQRSLVVNPVGGAARPHVSNEQHVDLFVGLGAKTPLPRVARIIAAGGKRAVEHALKTGVTPESRRRWADLVADVRALRDDLRRRGAHLVVVMDYDEDFQRLAAHLLLEAMPDLEVVFLLRERKAEHGVKDDPHPNPRTIAAGARRLAAFLLEGGSREGGPRQCLVLEGGSGEGRSPLPDVDPLFADQTVATPSRETLRAWADEYRGMIAGFLESAIDLEDGTGFHQVYGGMEPDGTVGRALWCTLRSRGAREIALRVAAVEGARVLQPLELTVALRGAGALAGEPVRVVLETDGELVVPIAEALRGQDHLDVLVRAPAWVEEVSAGRSRLAAFRVRRVEAR